VSALVLLVVWAICEGGWAVVPALRPQRGQMRLHLFLFSLLVAGIYAGTVLGLIPDRFQYGNGVLRYASDSITYQSQAATVAASLRDGSMAGLTDVQIFGYSKLLGLVFAITGTNALAAMLVNGAFYVATLACVFLIGRELFGAQVGALAMALASVWPGFVLHEAQTIRWVETTLGLELTVLGSVLLIGPRGGVGAILAGFVGYTLLISDLPYMARIVGVFVTLFGLGLVAIAVRQGKLIRPAVLTFVLGVSMLTTFYIVYVYPSTVKATEETSSMVGNRLGDTSDDSAGLLRRIVRAITRNVSVVITARGGFDRANREGQVGTALPAERLDSAPELLWNLPRAMIMAAFAPFPGTLLSGASGVSNLRHWVILELLPYLLIVVGAAVAVITALRGLQGPVVRRQTIFIGLLVLIAYALLGTVVLNAGTLYRFRQPYVLLQIILAVEGWRQIVARIRRTSN
jgi:hypothetical protein